MTDLRLRIPKVLALILLLAVLPLALSSLPAAGSPGLSFTTFELGRFDVPGTRCPSSNTNCFNVNAEPQIRADPAGNFYASSECLPRVAQCSIVLDLLNPQCGGTGAWKSSDNGLHYVTLPSPNALTAACSTTFPCNTSFSPFGGDTDLAVASRKNDNGFYNVYVVSLERATGPLLTVEESTSRDRGHTWTINPTGATVPVDDRPWVAADGSDKVCVSYHNLATTGVIFVTCSDDGGTTFAKAVSTYDSNHLWLADLNTQIGSLTIDPNNHVIYQIFNAIVANQDEGVACLTGCTNNFYVTWVAVSIDRGKTFTDYPV